MVPGMLRGEPNWKELKSHGVGWWVKSSDMLKRLIEKVCEQGNVYTLYCMYSKIFILIPHDIFL